MKQTRFKFARESTAYGGEKKRGRKSMRPLCTKRGVHLILKTRANLFQESETVMSTLVPLAHKFEIKVYDLALGFNHAHFLPKFPSRAAYRKFIRAVTGLLAKKLGAKLFTQLPFSRLFTWQREFWSLKRYMLQNREEAMRRRPYKKSPGRSRARGRTPTKEKSNDDCSSRSETRLFRRST